MNNKRLSSSFCFSFHLLQKHSKPVGLATGLFSHIASTSLWLPQLKRNYMQFFNKIFISGTLNKLHLPVPIFTNVNWFTSLAKFLTLLSSPSPSLLKPPPRWFCIHHHKRRGKNFQHIRKGRETNGSRRFRPSWSKSVLHKDGLTRPQAYPPSHPVWALAWPLTALGGESLNWADSGEREKLLEMAGPVSIL